MAYQAAVTVEDGAGVLATHNVAMTEADNPERVVECIAKRGFWVNGGSDVFYPPGAIKKIALTVV
jgi:hypothetical protein